MNRALPHLVEYEESEAAIDLRAILNFVRRRWKLIASITALVVLAAIVVLLRLTPLYVGTAQILLDNRRQNVLGPESVVPDLTFDSGFVESQVAVLRSRSLLRKVVEKENLTEDPEFGVSATPSEGLVRQLLGRIVGRTSKGSQQRAEPDRIDAPVDVLISIEKLRGRLVIDREGTSYAISISVISESPRRAAQLANAVADAYIDEQLEASYDTAQRAAVWLGDRIRDLRQEVLNSESAVEEYRTQHDLVSTKTGTVNEQQLSELNAELVNARADTAEKRAKYEQAAQMQAEGDNLQSIPDVLRSPVVSALRQRLADVSAREADLISRYGRRYPAVANVSAERADVERQIAAEVLRIIVNLKNDLEVAESRESSLQASLEKLTGETGVDNKVAVRLRELERIANANKILYESFLARAKVANEETTFAARDARVISTAIPSGTPSYPRKKFTIAVALFLGLGLGVGSAFLLEILSPGYLSPRQVEEVMEVPVLASIPLMRGSLLEVDNEKLSPPRYLLKKPLSRYSESIRALRSAVQMCDSKSPPQLIQVTSAVPGEGKTTLAMSMAFSLQAAGNRVLLLDADLRHPSISNLFELGDRPGLVDVLASDTVGANEVRPYRDPESKLHVFPAGRKSPNPSDLLGSERMKAFVEMLRKHYQFILIDSPPVGPVVDAVVLSRLSDKVVFAVKWAETPRDVAAEAVRQFPEAHKIVGVALNQVDDSRGGGYKYTGSSYYKSYYVE